jgi:hypothetical protein
VIDIKGHELVDFQGTYEEYLASQQTAERAASAG